MSEPSRDLDHSLVQGIAWTGGVRWFAQILSWIATLAIARLLSPQDYGLFGMASVWVGLAQIIGESGPTAAVIQRRELDDNQIARLGGLSVLVGLGLGVASVTLAWPIAWFYRAPGVQAMVAVLGAVFVIRSFSVLPRGLMARDLEFRQLAWVDGLESLSLLGFTLAGALMRMGPWALVAGSLGSSSVSTVLALCWRRHRLAWPRDIPQLGGAVRFAVHVVASQIAAYAFSNADFAVVGRRLGSAALGAYSLAWTVASIPVDRISGLVSRVTPAYFAAVQKDLPTMRRYFRHLTEGLAFITWPACIGLGLVAERFVPIVFGPQWGAAVRPLELLAVYAATRSIIVLTPQVLFATDRSRLTMHFSIAAAVILPIIFYIGSQWGTPGVAVGWLIGYPAIAVAGFVRPALKASGLSWREYLLALWPAGSATVVMAAAVLLVQRLSPGAWSAPLRLAVDISVGAAAYTLTVLLAHGGRVRAIRSLLRDTLAASRAVTPWHSTARANGRTRLLLISQHFPPDSAVGALRWQKLARLAAERGWGLDVIALDPGQILRRDDSRLADLPPGVRIYAVRRQRTWLERVAEFAWRVVSGLAAPVQRALQGASVGPSGARTSRGRAEMRRWFSEPRDLVRLYAALLDYIHGRQWARAARRVARQVIQPGVHRAVITCGPPHYAHLAGQRLARDGKLPWVMDLRDPWRLIQRLPEAVASPLWLGLAAWHERAAVRDASLIVANTHALRNAMRGAYPKAAPRIIAVPNGHDDDAVPSAPVEPRFLLMHAGTIYLDRDPRPLFRAAARFIAARCLTPREFGIEFLGSLEGPDGCPLSAIAAESGLGPFVTVAPPVARHEALRRLARGAMLAVLPQDSDMAVPAKVYDYMQFDAWMLAFADPGSAVAVLLQGSGADVVAGDVVACAAVLERRYEQFSRGERAVRLAANPVYSRRAQADILFNAMAHIADLPITPAPEPDPACVAS